MAFENTATIPSFGGKLLKLKHDASTTSCSMSLNMYLPPQAIHGVSKVPVLFYLSGLTCTADNCSEKGFFQSRASEKGIAIVYPDTSPRGLDIAGENDSWDFGTGAGFYVDATKEPWSKGYKMYSYIVDELPKKLFAAFSILDEQRVSIMGHSMGGHGALTIYLKNLNKYKSCSAFAPICNPIKCPWGQKAFSGYFGEDQKDKWNEHDATELIKQAKNASIQILVDQGTGDNFYKQKQLLPENLDAAAHEAGIKSGLTTRYQEDYDHSYYFMASFAKDHIDFHAKFF